MKDRFKKAWMALSEEERENIKKGARNLIYSVPLVVLNINNNNLSVNIYTIVLETIPIIKENIIDCFNRLLIIALSYLYLDISGTNAVLRANIKNEGIVKRANTYAL